MKMKCTSSNVSKTRMKINFGYNFQTTKMVCKLKHPNIKRNFFKYELTKTNRSSIKCTSKPKFKITTFKCLSLNTNAHVKMQEYKIENEFISKDILSFRDVAKIYIEVYNGKNLGKQIVIKSDSPYLVLKFHEKNIKSLDEFMKRKVQDVITDKLFFSLSCL
ncbi:MAG: hypothetical protein ACRCX2_36990 [Paraclostridium sp.]